MRNQFTLLLMAFAATITTFAQQTAPTPKADKAVYFDISPPLRDMVVTPQRYDNSWKDGVVPNYIHNAATPSQGDGMAPIVDALLQSTMGYLPGDTTLQNFDGLSAGGSVPPDTHGEAGPNHYFQVVNTSYAIYNKTGQKIHGPLPNSSIWSGMPNNANSGDAVVLYDEVANRWLFTQFSLPSFPSGPFYQMIAVSQTPDPMGSWYRWEYQFAQMPDYPKFGVWPDGYYMSANRFAGGWTGTGAYAFDRTAMLSGDPNAQRISFEFQLAGEGFITMLPSDCDGTFPPAGTPNFYTFIKTGGSQHLGVYEFHADWVNPSNATFGNNLSLNVTPFTIPNQGVTQKSTSVKLEGLYDRLMCNTKYRVFNGYSSMVLNHSVAAGSHVGVRWYELRKTGSTPWAIHQQSTYAPADNLSRWMGSIAIDTAGTIALGYSVSGSTLFPSIRYTGRFKNDPLNTMTIAEQTIIHGGGAQTGIWSGRSRWGDYSAMSVDPAAPTTFWFTTEYYANTSSGNWQTRVGSFTYGNSFSLSSSAYPAKLCAGDSSQLRAFAYGGSGNYTYSWSSVPPGFTSNQANPVVYPGDTTHYFVSVTDGTTTKTDSVKVNVVQLPTAFAGNDTVVCSWLTSLPLHGVATHYRMCGWGTTGNGTFNTTSGTDAIYTFGSLDRSNGWVDLKFVALPLSPCAGNVISTRHIIIDACTGVEEPLNVPALKLIPNPARSHVTITVSGLRNHGATLSIITMEGETVYTHGFEPTEREQLHRVDLSRLGKGVYVVQLKGDTGIKTERLVVQ